MTAAAEIGSAARTWHSVLHGVLVAAMGLPEGRPLEGMEEPMILPSPTKAE